MKLLIVAQVVDTENLVLGFFHTWIKELAPHFEVVNVICLYEGKHDLPTNVHVHSLGKEKGSQPSVVYAFRFLALAWGLRNYYDRVFVHMNQEYLLIAGWLWKVLGKPAYLWRNHYAGSLLTDIAVMFSNNVFCTSIHSYTAKFKRTIIMPVGIDLERFTKHVAAREPRSILFFSRMAPSKRADLFIEALGLLLKKGVSFIADVYGTPLPEHETFYENVQARAKALDLGSRVRFHPGVAMDKSPDVFGSHEIFVNAAASGMFDKMIFEAAAAGCIVLATSDDFNQLTQKQFAFTDAESLAGKLEEVLVLPNAKQNEMRAELADLAEKQALSELITKLSWTLTA